MNKQLIVLLAVCLISVQCFVKREAEKQDNLNDILANINEFGKSIETKFKETFNPDEIKKEFNQFVDKVNQGLKDISGKTEGAPKQ